MDNLNLMEYWLNSSDEDYNVMQYLYKGKKNSYCLFFGHLVQVENIEEVRTWLKKLLMTK